MRRLSIALLMLLAAPAALAQVYKWTDAQGTVHYSQSPPPKGMSYTQIRHVGSAEPLAASPAASHAPPEAAISSASDDQTVPDTPRNRDDLCRSLQSNLAVLHGKAPVIMEKNGQKTALDADQRQAQLQQTQQQYDQFCGSQGQ